MRVYCFCSCSRTKCDREDLINHYFLMKTKLQWRAQTFEFKQNLNTSSQRNLHHHTTPISMLQLHKSQMFNMPSLSDLLNLNNFILIFTVKIDFGILGITQCFFFLFFHFMAHTLVTCDNEYHVPISVFCHHHRK